MSETNYIPALRFRVLTSVYDPLIRLTTRKTAFKTRLLRPGGDLWMAGWGRPQDLLMAVEILAVRLLGGFAPTRENVAGAGADVDDHLIAVDLRPLEDSSA